MSQTHPSATHPGRPDAGTGRRTDAGTGRRTDAGTGRRTDAGTGGRTDAPDAGTGGRADAPGASRSDDANARRDADGTPGPGRADAVVAGAVLVSDALMEVGEALVAAVLGALTGAGKAARGIWVADRPRRQRARMARRRRWLHRKGWWRAAVVLELVAVGAWLGGRAAVRAVRGVPSGAAQGARTGWATGRDRAQERRGTRRGAPTAGPTGGAGGGPGPSWCAPGPWAGGPASTAPPEPAGASTSTTSPGHGDGELIVDAELLCGRAGCETVLAPDDRGPYCPACTQARAAAGAGEDDVQVTVEVTPPQPRFVRYGPGGMDWIVPADAGDIVGSPDDGDGEITPDPWPTATAEQDAARRLAGDGPVEVGDLDPGVVRPGPAAVPAVGPVVGPVVEAVVTSGADLAMSVGTECTWLEQDGSFCGAELPLGELFCLRHGAPGGRGREWGGRDEGVERFFALREAGYRSWIDDGGYAVAGSGRRLALREVEAIIAGGGYPSGGDRWPGPAVGEADRRAAALRAAGWAGPIDPDGHAVHGESQWTQLAGVLAAIEQEATGPGPCCRCVLDPNRPQWDQVADCRCVVGQGADRDACTCGPWDLATAVAEDDAAEDRGDIDGDDRATCHRCQDWADHAHRPFTGERITRATHHFEVLLREHPSLRARLDRLAQQDSTGQDSTTPQSPAGLVAGGSAGQHDQHDQQDGTGHRAGPGGDDVQEDGMGTTDTTEMTITSGSGGTTVAGGARMGRELSAVGDLRAEVTVMRRYAETGMQMLTDLESWAAGLPEQVAGAQWSTEAVSAAAVGLAQARTVEEVRQGITGLLQAAAQAEQLGEALAAGGARKGVAGLRPQ